MKKWTAFGFAIFALAFALTGCAGRLVRAEVRWEYTPYFSSRYPAMPFSFDISCQEIMATCNNGTLIDFDHFNDVIGKYPSGKSLTIQNAGKLYWAPWDEEEYADAASAVVTFTVVDQEGAVLHEGALDIVQKSKTTGSAIYSAKLEDGSGLALTQDEGHQSGGILS